jgi:tetratricopeptide (TPR) repeat protein
MRVALVGLALVRGTQQVAHATGASAAYVDPDVEVAQRHFARGQDHYAAARYEEAIVEFKRAREAKPLPDFDYNIARCYDRLGKWKDALAFYERYLQGADASPAADEVRARVVELRARTAGAARVDRPVVDTASPGPSTAPTAVPGPARAPLRIPAIVLGALAFGTLAAGTGAYAAAAFALPDRRAYCAGLSRECVPSDWSDLSARATAGYALWAIGGAVAVVDVSLWIIDGRRLRRERQRPGAQPAFALGGASRAP